MAKLCTQTARKQYTCSRCGKVINPGDTYHKIVAAFSPVRIRCTSCRPERSELTGSEYLSWLYHLQDHLEDDFDICSEEGKDELISELQDQLDQLQERLDNMPEQLQESDSGLTLQDRIDSLDSAISDLESLEFPDEDEIRSNLLQDDEEDEEFDEEEFDSNEVDDLDASTQELSDDSDDEEFQQAWEDALDDFADEIRNIVDSISE